MSGWEELTWLTNLYNNHQIKVLNLCDFVENRLYVGIVEKEHRVFWPTARAQRPHCRMMIQRSWNGKAKKNLESLKISASGHQSSLLKMRESTLRVLMRNTILMIRISSLDEPIVWAILLKGLTRGNSLWPTIGGLSWNCGVASVKNSLKS